jgi:DNA replication licensing factor MCM4
VPEGETPHTIQLCAYEDLVDYVKPGDRVEVIGIYKASGVRINQHNRTLKNVYRTFIDVINYVKTDRRRYDVELKQDGIREEKGDVKMNEENEGD